MQKVQKNIKTVQLVSLLSTEVPSKAQKILQKVSTDCVLG